MKTMILAQIHLLHGLLPPVNGDRLKLTKGDGNKSGTRVIAAQAIPAGELKMAPVVTGPASLTRVCKETVAPYTLKVKVMHGNSVSEWSLVGGGALPPSPAVAGSAAVLETHNWTAGHNPWPLWYVQKAIDVSDSNCIFEEVDVRCVNTFAFKSSAVAGEPMADSIDLTIPVLVNTKALAENDELIVHWKPQISRKAQQRAQITWATQARSKMATGRLRKM